MNANPGRIEMVVPVHAGGQIPVPVHDQPMGFHGRVRAGERARVIRGGANQVGANPVEIEPLVPLSNDYKALNLESKKNKKYLKKINNHEFLGMFITIKNDPSIDKKIEDDLVEPTTKNDLRLKLTTKIGHDDLFEYLHTLPDINNNGKVAKTDFIHMMRIHSYDVSVLTECPLLIKTYPDIFIPIFWNILGKTEMKPRKYMASIWERNHVRQGVQSINNHISTYYQLLGNDQIYKFRVIFFTQTFQYLVYQLSNHIKNNYNLDDEIRRNYINRPDILKYICSNLILFYGNNNYDNIMENIDEFLKFTTPKNIAVIANRYSSSNTVEMFTPDTVFDFDNLV